MAVVAEHSTSPLDSSLVPITVVTADSHVGPRLREDLRPYCPSPYLDDFDGFVREFTVPEGGTHVHVDVEGNRHPDAQGRALRARHNAALAGHYDMAARLDDMDRDGIAAEVIFHGSQNGQPFPFVDDPLSTFKSRLDGDTHHLELVAVGQQIYNRWLADVSAVAPERRVGLAHLPLWNIDGAVIAVREAREAGLRAVNFPAPRPGMREVDDPAWEPFWSACEELDMPLVTHCGVVNPESWNGPLKGVLKFLEGGGWMSRRALVRFIFGGVFERHASLRLVYTELMQQPSTWWPGTVTEYDQAWERRRWMVGDMCPRPPSEYFQANVFLGSSLLHRYPPETQIAVREGFADNVLWGGDYPHVEGTLTHSEPGDPTSTRVAMQICFAHVDEYWQRRMLGETAVEVYHLDRDALASVAAHIGAPTPAQLRTPLPSRLIPTYWTGAD